MSKFKVGDRVKVKFFIFANQNGEVVINKGDEFYAVRLDDGMMCVAHESMLTKLNPLQVGDRVMAKPKFQVGEEVRLILNDSIFKVVQINKYNDHITYTALDNCGRTTDIFESHLEKISTESNVNIEIKKLTLRVRKLKRDVEFLTSQNSNLLTMLDQVKKCF